MLPLVAGLKEKFHQGKKKGVCVFWISTSLVASNSNSIPTLGSKAITEASMNFWDRAGLLLLQLPPPMPVDMNCSRSSSHDTATLEKPGSGLWFLWELLAPDWMSTGRAGQGIQTVVWQRLAGMNTWTLASISFLDSRRPGLNILEHGTLSHGSSTHPECWLPPSWCKPEIPHITEQDEHRL